MRYSKQREEILRTIKTSEHHLDASGVYKMVRKTIPNISLGTVYRNLNDLEKNGFIKKIKLKNGNDVYDKNVVNHNHIYCVSCGKVMDINLNLDEKDVKKLERQTGFKITDCNFNINGICKSCINKKEE